MLSESYRALPFSNDSQLLFASTLEAILGEKEKNSYNSQGNKKSEYCKLSEHDLIIYARYFNAIFVICKLKSIVRDFARDLGNLNNSQLYGLAFLYCISTRFYLKNVLSLKLCVVINTERESAANVDRVGF